MENERTAGSLHHLILAWHFPLTYQSAIYQHLNSRVLLINLWTSSTYLARKTLHKYSLLKIVAIVVHKDDRIQQLEIFW